MGADSSIENLAGKTAIDLARVEGYHSIESLLKRSENVNIRNDAGETALHWSSGSGNGKVLLLMVLNGANINAQDNYGRTPLHLAILNGHEAEASLLLMRGAKVNIRNSTGATPLHFASSKGHVDIVSLLLQYGADVEMKDCDGHTPLYFAYVREHGFVVAMLLRKILGIQDCEEGSKEIQSHLAYLKRQKALPQLDPPGDHSIYILESSDHARGSKSGSIAGLVEYDPHTTNAQSGENQATADNALVDGGMMEEPSKQLVETAGLENVHAEETPPQTDTNNANDQVGTTTLPGAYRVDGIDSHAASDDGTLLSTASAEAHEDDSTMRWSSARSVTGLTVAEEVSIVGGRGDNVVQAEAVPINADIFTRLNDLETRLDEQTEAIERHQKGVEITCCAIS